MAVDGDSREVPMMTYSDWSDARPEPDINTEVASKRDEQLGHRNGKESKLFESIKQKQKKAGKHYENYVDICYLSNS